MRAKFKLNKDLATILHTNADKKFLSAKIFFKHFLKMKNVRGIKSRGI